MNILFPPPIMTWTPPGGAIIFYYSPTEFCRLPDPILTLYPCSLGADSPDPYFIAPGVSGGVCLSV